MVVCRPSVLLFWRVGVLACWRVVVSLGFGVHLRCWKARTLDCLLLGKGREQTSAASPSGGGSAGLWATRRADPRRETLETAPLVSGLRLPWDSHTWDRRLPAMGETS